MFTVQRQIDHARRRLMLSELLRWLCRGVLVGAALWGATVFIVRLFAWEVPVWHGAWLAAVLALAIGLAGMAWMRPSALRAAVALDAAAGLKERLSTALLVARDDDPFARAVVQDAERAAARVHVPTHIRYRTPGLWPWSLSTSAAALLLAIFMRPIGLLAGEKAKEPGVSRAVLAAEREAIQAELDRQLGQIRELAATRPDLDDLVKDIQPLPEPQKANLTPEDVRREAVKRIDDVRERLKRELEQAEGDALAELRRMLSRLEQSAGSEEGDKLSKSLAAGDFASARQALDETLKEIQEAAKSADDPAARAKLAEMERKLGQLGEQLAKLGESVQLQKELENKAGLSEEEAKKLLRELGQVDPKQLEKELQQRLGEKGLSQQQLEQIARKIRQNQQARQACRNLAKALSQASQACQQCSRPGQAGQGAGQAAGALSDAASQLSELEMAEQLLGELEAQLSDLENLRDDVCSGGLCPGNRPGQGDGRMVGPQGPQAGLGIGERIGRQRTPYRTDPTKAKTRFEGGSIVGQLLIDGPQVRGEASAAELSAAEAEVRAALDAIERQDVPRQYEKVLREYFERLAGLVRERQGGGKAADGGAP